MDKPSDAPRTRAQTRNDLITLIDSYLTTPLKVTVETPYGVSTFHLEPLPYSDPADTGPFPRRGPPRLSPMERDLLEAAASSVNGPLTGPELAKRAGYPPHSGARHALTHLRDLGLLGGAPNARGYPITDAGRRALAT
jgi:hypothetical protein